MFIKQSELFWDLGHDFVKEIMEEAEKESMARGYVLYFEGQPASHFYFLIKGRVQLKVGQDGMSVFMLNHPGECFGWSSLAGREKYSTTTECLADTSVFKIDRRAFDRACRRYPQDGLMFMKRLAALLTGRLVQAYEMMNACMRREDYRLYGTGQVQETAAEQ
jgi:CRP-like cAMP-binding protein